MKVLFISSGKLGDVSAVVKNQGDSLVKKGITIDYFIIRSGIWGYLSGIFKIRQVYRKGDYDLVHAHYSLSAYVASFSGCRPVVVSLLGSDAFTPLLVKLITRFFYKFCWNITIVKTEEMKSRLKFNNAFVIPNGVNTERFLPIPREVAREKIGYRMPYYLVVFISNPNRQEKNFKLAKEAVDIINRTDKIVELMPVFNIPNDEIPYFINASNAVILTSKHEGGVNIIKEAMACNVPFVSTDVGDVKENSKGIAGCYVCEHSADAIAENLLKAIEVERSNGRERIIQLGLNSEQVAGKLISIYNSVK